MITNKKTGYILTITGIMMVLAGATTLVLANEQDTVVPSAVETTAAELEMAGSIEEKVAESLELVAEVETKVENEMPMVASSASAPTQQKTQQPNGVKKGEQFVDYIVNKFDFSRKSISLVSRNEGTGDIPDLVIKLNAKGMDHRFAVECAWRSSMPEDELIWASEDKIGKIENYIRNHNMKTFIVIGIGGSPSAPQKLYIVPFDERPYRNLYTSVLEKYKCQSVSGKFFYDPNTKKLTIK